jgi:hypothetical protein
MTKIESFGTWYKRQKKRKGFVLSNKRVVKRKMTSYLATGIAEGFEKGTPAEQKRAWQYLVDTGTAWRLQGWFGRTASSLIEQGLIHAPKRRTIINQTDYYGNNLYGNRLGKVSPRKAVKRMGRVTR